MKRRLLGARVREQYGLRGSGFTLVELLVTVVVLAMMMVIAIPAFARMSASNAVRGAASDLQMALLEARSQAITLNGTATIEPESGGWNKGWKLSAGSVVRSYPGHAGMDVKTNPSSLSKIEYGYSGRVGNSPTIEFKSTAYADEVRCVTVDASGRPLITKAVCP